MGDLKVLVVGNGGREHAIAQHLAASSLTSRVYVAPGNAGTALLEKGENVPYAALETDKIVAFVKEKAIPWVVIGPEAPLVAGLADPLRANGVMVFGPSKAAAQLEGSKIFNASFLARHNIPHAKSDIARTLDEALKIIEKRAPNTYVLKADGLASGKGVVLPKTVEEAQEVLVQMFSGKGFEGAGKNGVVIQERLHGPEVSAFAISDGKNFVLLPFTQDHKRLKDKDEGPNTGGMGAITPLPFSIVSKDQAAKIRAIAKQTIAGMAKDGTPFSGVLFMGLMLAEEYGGDPVVIEDNVRFGDPEVEALFALLSDAGVDVADMLYKASKGDLSSIVLPKTYSKVALTVALAVSGYPDAPRKGDPIHGLDVPRPGIDIHHAGTKQEGNQIITAGGRVLYVTALGETADEAAKRAYAAIGTPTGITFDDAHWRADIGHQIRT